MTIQQKIDNLQSKINYLQSKQEDYQKYIDTIQTELNSLKIEVTSNEFIEKPTESIESEKTFVTDLGKIVIINEETPTIIEKVQARKASFTDKIKKEIGFDWDIKADWENFIGTNLINKIGILILIFGVIVGAKYSIDNNLISPLTRIISGYLISLVLLATSIKLKDKYTNFSAVLLSGSLATLYFLSFISYDFYGFISQTTSFVLMFVFTAFAVVASLSYNKQIIALIGLVGSYAVPFLLSNNSGNVAFLFSYMAIVNVGILILSFKKNWKLLYYTAFVFTWLIFIFWYLNDYSFSLHFLLGFGFVFLFFIIFYITFLAYKLLKKETFVKSDVVFIMLNSFIFFSIGLSILGSSNDYREFQGLFTVLNAIVHFGVSRIVFQQKDGDKRLFYLATVMVLIFITLAIPIQLKGAWIALLWTLEASLLFWVGRTKNIPIYERISYVLILLSFFALYGNWTNSYVYKKITPFLNVHFLSSLIASVAFGFMTKIAFDKNYTSSVVLKKGHSVLSTIQNTLYKSIKYIIPTFFIIILFATFSNEISQYFDIQYDQSLIETNNSEQAWKDYNYDYNIRRFKTLSLLFYAMIFASIATFINLYKIKNKIVGTITLIASTGLLFLALFVGLMECSELRDSFLNFSADVDLYSSSLWQLNIRYINYGFIGLMVFTIYKTIIAYYNTRSFKQYFWLGFHIVVLWILSSELIHWMDIYNYNNAYKIAITILWASYSLFAIALGIWKKHKFLRLGAIGMFGITLVKLFIYDLANLSTIHKTIVLISVGVLLLIVSFLYNKYTSVINEENTLK